MVDGTAPPERDPRVIQRFIAVYEPKYQMGTLDPIPGAAYAVRPQAVFGIGATPFDTATRWVFDS